MAQVGTSPCAGDDVAVERAFIVVVGASDVVVAGLPSIALGRVDGGALVERTVEEAAPVTARVVWPSPCCARTSPNAEMLKSPIMARLTLCFRRRSWRARARTESNVPLVGSGGFGSSNSSSTGNILSEILSCPFTAQSRKSPRGVLLHGALRTSELCSYRVLGKIRYITQNENLALSLGQG